jgi:glycosyltransferase involved in cell wall biosynthesis
MALLKAMVSGVPMIASNSGACFKMVRKAGSLLNRENHVELAEKILCLSDEKKLSSKLSKVDLKRVRETFSLKDEVDQYS